MTTVPQPPRPCSPPATPPQVPYGWVEAAIALLRQGVTAAAATRGAPFELNRVAASVVSIAGGACVLRTRRYRFPGLRCVSLSWPSNAEGSPGSCSPTSEQLARALSLLLAPAATRTPGALSSATGSSLMPWTISASRGGSGPAGTHGATALAGPAVEVRAVTAAVRCLDAACAPARARFGGTGWIVAFGLDASAPPRAAGSGLRRDCCLWGAGCADGACSGEAPLCPSVWGGKQPVSTATVLASADLTSATGAACKPAAAPALDGCEPTGACCSPQACDPEASAGFEAAGPADAFFA